MFICIGKIFGAHGVRGLTKIKCLLSAPNQAVFNGELCDVAGNQIYQAKLHSFNADVGLVALSGVTTREQAQSLRGTLLYVSRAILPIIEEDEGYYFIDLIGCQAFSPEGELVGVVSNMLNFGAGDIAEIEHLNGKTELYPFSDAVFPEVDIQAKRLTLIPPEVV